MMRKATAPPGSGEIGEASAKTPESGFTVENIGRWTDPLRLTSVRKCEPFAKPRLALANARGMQRARRCGMECEHAIGKTNIVRVVPSLTQAVVRHDTPARSPLRDDRLPAQRERFRLWNWKRRP